MIPELRAFTEALKGRPRFLQDRCKQELYDFFEGRLSKGQIALGSPPGSTDTERTAIDTVVVHHTSNPPGLSPMRLSAIELIRLYGPYFLVPSSDADMHLRGRPIYSGHERDGKQVFWPYHWIVRWDGRNERLLYDSEIGWHAGNWNVNCRSVAIALDNDYEWGHPSNAELEGVANIIIAHYGDVPSNRILGHREVTSKTTCPSELFLCGPDGYGWKHDLLTRLPSA